MRFLSKILYVVGLVLFLAACSSPSPLQTSTGDEGGSADSASTSTSVGEATSTTVVQPETTDVSPETSTTTTERAVSATTTTETQVETATTEAPATTSSTTEAPEESTTTTTEPPTTPTTNPPAPDFAFEAGLTMSGRWTAVSLTVDGEPIELVDPTPGINVAGRSLNGTDGCNSFGNGSVVWEDDGALTVDRSNADSTLVGCTGQVAAVEQAFSRALSNANAWGLTSSGNLVLAGLTTRVDFELAGEAAPLDGAEIGPIGDTTLQLIRETEQFAALPSDAELPLLIVSGQGTTATLSSTECEVAYSVNLPANAGEGAIAFGGAAASECPAGSTSRTVAEVLQTVDYVLTLNVGEASLMQLWAGSESVALFATEGAGFDG